MTRKNRTRALGSSLRDKIRLSDNLKSERDLAIFEYAVFLEGRIDDLCDRLTSAEAAIKELQSGLPRQSVSFKAEKLKNSFYVGNTDEATEVPEDKDIDF